MTLNDLERNSPYFAFLPNSIDFQADYVTLIDDVRRISPSSYIWPKNPRSSRTVSLRQLSFLSYLAHI